MNNGTGAIVWAVLCGAAAGAIMGWATGSTPIGMGVLIVVGALAAYLTDRWRRRRGSAGS